jgi:Protein of unknown function (DUF4239)
VSLWLSSVIVASAAAAAVGLMYLVRTRSNVDLFFAEIERGAGVFAFLGAAFAVLLAFVVLVSFESFNDARTGAEREATMVLLMSRSLDFFPPDERDPMVGTLICYGRAVIHDAWPRLQDGDRSPLVQDWVERFDEGLTHLSVETPKQESAFLHLLEQEDQRAEARRMRVTEANRALPAPVWFLLGVGALMTLGFALFFADRRELFFVQGSLIAAVTVLVVSGLLLVWFLDHPYENRSGSIKPEEMERLLPLVEAEHESVAAPCNEEGSPVQQATSGTDSPSTSYGGSSLARVPRMSLGHLGRSSGRIRGDTFEAEAGHYRVWSRRHDYRTARRVAPGSEGPASPDDVALACNLRAADGVDVPVLRPRVDYWRCHYLRLGAACPHPKRGDPGPDRYRPAPHQSRRLQYRRSEGAGPSSSLE